MINRGHAYLIENTTETAANKQAKEVIKTILCENKGCLTCQQCNSIEIIQNPNVIHVNGFEESIKNEHIITIKDFCSVQNFTNKKQIIFIEGIENATPKAANSFLKFLEEPQEGIIFIMTTLNKQMVLPTVVSRTQEIKAQNINFQEEESNDVLKIINNEPFEINWSKLSKNEIKGMLVLMTRVMPLKDNEKFLKQTLKLVNKLNANVNKNIVVAELIAELKERRI